MVKRWAMLAALLLSASSGATGVDGWGRVSLGGGFRWVPNWWFQDKAAAAGTPMVPTVDGGPNVNLSFGYGLSSIFEASVDLLGGYQTFELQDDDARVGYTVINASGLLGVRLTGELFKGFMPYLTAQAGPMFVSISSAAVLKEQLVLALSAAGGATVRVGDRYGVSFEVRYINGRSVVPDLSGINVGGVWFSVSFTMFFPPALKSELSVPGF